MSTERYQKTMINKIVIGLTQAEIAEELGITKYVASRFLNGLSPDTLDTDTANDFFNKHSFSAKVLPADERNVIRKVACEDAEAQYRMAQSAMKADAGTRHEWSSCRNAIFALMSKAIDYDYEITTNERSVSCDRIALETAKNLYQKLPSLVNENTNQHAMVKLLVHQNELSIEMLIEKFCEPGINAASEFIKGSEHFEVELRDLLNQQTLNAHQRLFLREIYLLATTALLEAYLESDQKEKLFSQLNHMQTVFPKAKRSDFELLAIASAWPENKERFKSILGYERVSCL